MSTLHSGMRPLALIFALAAAAMVSAEQQTPTFKSTVTLVTVDVTVLDKDGKPVPGLTAEDFRIKLNGKSQSVQTLTYVDVTPVAAAPDSHALTPEVTGRQVVSNTTPQATQRVFVVTVDDMSFPPEGGNRLLKAARRFVDQQPRDVFVGLATTSGRTVINPTLDRAVVRDALSRVKGTFHDPRKSSVANAAAVGIVEAIEIVDHNNNAVLDSVLARECGNAGKGDETSGNNVYARPISIYNEMCANAAKTTARMIASDMRETTGRQIASIAAALDAMQGARGLKQMLLLSEGIASTRGATDVIAPISRAAAQAGVQLSVIMEDTEDVDISDSGHTLNDLAATTYNTGVSNRLRDDRAMFRASLQTLANIAGGTFDLVVGSGDNAFDHAVTAGSAIYRLGVETPSEMPKAKLLSVDVAVSRPNVTAHANSQVLAQADANGQAVSATSKEEVDRAMKTGTPLYRVPIRLAVVRRRASLNSNIELGFGLEVPSSVKGPLTMTLGLVDQKGGLKKGTRILPVPAASANYLVTVPILVDPGMYGLRVAVTDALGNVGSLETNVDANLPAMATATMGPIALSDVLTWSVDPAGNSQLLALDDIPASVNSLGAGLELYPANDAALPPDLSVTMSVLPAGSAAAVLTREATLRPGRDMARAEVSVPLADLAPGVYVLKATVKVGSQVVGEASAVIRKR